MAKDLETSSNVVKVSDVVDVDVKNNKGENLGTIKEIILDKTTGNIRYIVLSFGGFWGLGDKYFALPWNSISYDEDKESFVLNIEKEKLDKAPGFDKNQWPDISDRRWEESIYSYYGYKPYWEDQNNRACK